MVVALAVFVVASLLDERSSKARLLRERLSTVQKTPEREPGQELALLRDEVMSKIPALDNLLRRSSSISNLQTLLEQADVKSRAGNVLLLCLLSGAGLGLIVLLFSGFPQFAWLGSDPGRVSSLLVRQLQDGPNASRNSKRFFPKPSTPWPARFAPATLSPPRWN